MKVLAFITVCALSVGAVFAQNAQQGWGDLGKAAAGKLIKAALGNGQGEEQSQKTAGQSAAKPTAFGDNSPTEPAKTLGTGGQVTDKSVEKLDDNTVIVKAKGKGKTKEEAKLDAYRKAVEKAVGVYVDAQTMLQNDQLVKDQINTISNAEIGECDELGCGENDDGWWYEIEAVVKKDEIAPKFNNIFPGVFQDVKDIANKTHAEISSREQRAKDAVKLITDELKDFDPIHYWTKLSIVRDDSLKVVSEILDERGNVCKVTRGGEAKLVSVRYTISFDKAKYKNDFLPHFAKTLDALKTGNKKTGTIVSTDVPGSRTYFNSHAIEETIKRYFGDRQPGCYYFRLDKPFCFTKFPAFKGKSGRDGYDYGQYEIFENSSRQIMKGSPYIWVLTSMNLRRTVVEVDAYPVSKETMRAYIDSMTKAMSRPAAKIKISLLDEEGEMLGVKEDSVPMSLALNGLDEVRTQNGSHFHYELKDSFPSYFIAPVFHLGCDSQSGPKFASELSRDVYFTLTNEELGMVKDIKVEFINDDGESASDEELEEQMD